MKNKPEFQLAIGIFIAISVIGTAFGLWFATQYAPMPRSNTNAAKEAAPSREQETPPRAQ